MVMQFPSTSILLDLWERGGRGHSSLRYVPLLSYLHPEEDHQRWPLGRRDLELFRCRSLMFGDSISCYLCCDECANEMEFSLSIKAITDKVMPPPETINVEIDGQSQVVNLPTCQDLLEVKSREQLLQRCIGTGVQFDAANFELVEMAMSEGDPLANLQIGVDCPHCQHQFHAHFDISCYFWDELERWSKTTLKVVHRLASRYGWSERDILAMSAWRRRHYLELING